MTIDKSVDWYVGRNIGAKVIRCDLGRVVIDIGA